MNPVTIPEQRLPEMMSFYAQQVTQPGWDEVSNVFGIYLPPGEGHLDQRANGLRVLVGRFDARNSEERWGAKLNVYVDRSVADLEKMADYYQGLGELGLIGTQQVDVSQAGLRILSGGTVDAMVMRSLHSQGGLEEATGQIAYSGSVRPLLPADIDSMSKYFPDADYEPTEAGAMHCILEHMHPDRQLVQGDDLLKVYETPTGLVYWANAPISPDLPTLADDDPNRSRANTADTYHFLASELGSAMLGDTATIVTNDIYVPFQSTDAWHVLKGIHGVANIRTAGFTPAEGARLITERFMPVDAKVRTPGTYAQEVRSYQRSLARLGLTLQNSLA